MPGVKLLVYLYGIILSFFGTFMVQNQQDNNLLRPDNAISKRY